MEKIKKVVLCIIVIALIAAIVAVVVTFAMSKVGNKPNPVVTMEVEGYGTIKLELYPDKAPNTVKNFIRLAQRGYYNGKGFSDIEAGLIEGGFNESSTTSIADTTDAVDAASEDSSSKNLTPGAKLSDIRDGGEDKEYAIAGEFIENGHNDNTLSHTRGVISMFRKSYTQYQQEIAMMRMMGYDDYLNSMINKMYDSQSSAFFILTQDNTGYDGTYAAFGKVIEGMDVVDKISQTELQKTTDENGEETVSSKPVNVPIIKNVTVETYGVDYGEPETMEVFDFDAIFNSIMQMYMQSQSTTTSY